MEKGIPGGRVVLDVQFYQYNGGPLVDDDRYTTSGVLPTVQIFNPEGTQVYSSTDPWSVVPARASIGRYDFTYEIPIDSALSDKYRIVWSIQIDGNTLEFSEFFRVVDPGSADYGQEDFRKGYAFGNPDKTSDHHAPGWGLLVTPDELRYDVMFGSKLTSPDANQTYTDDHLQFYIDHAIAIIERDLNIDLIPRKVRHEDPNDRVSGIPIPRTDIDAERALGKLLIRESGYPYRQQNARHYMYIKLRRRPLLQVTKAMLVNPVYQSMLDIYSWRRERKGFEASVEFFPNTTALIAFPGIPSVLSGSWYPYADFPAAYLIDYDTGFESADAVDTELRMAVYFTAGILLMENFGDGKAPGIAAASASLNSISESYNTTQSATNALYGARIVYFKDHLKDWMRRNAEKYSQNVIGVL